MVELPTGSASRGLGVGKTWYKLPLWIQKDFGPWTTYGGGGYEIVDQVGYSNFRYAGWLLQRDLGDKWTLGAGSGITEGGQPQTHSSTMVDVGGYYYFRKPAFPVAFQRQDTAPPASLRLMLTLACIGPGASKDADSDGAPSRMNPRRQARRGARRIRYTRTAVGP